MSILQNKMKQYFKYKNERLGKEIASELYLLLYKNNNGNPIYFGDIQITFKQTLTSIENDIGFIYYVLSKSENTIEV